MINRVYELDADLIALEEGSIAKFKKPFSWEMLIGTKEDAPVIIQKGNDYVFRKMQFSLIPSWSKKSHLRWSSHYARMESVSEKKTFKNSILTKRCLVPMTGFRASFHSGEYQGYVMTIQRPEKQLMFAAGLYDEWKGKEKKTLESFAIITRTIQAMDIKGSTTRVPAILDPRFFRSWLDPEVQDLESVYRILEEVPDFEYEFWEERKLKTIRKAS